MSLTINCINSNSIYNLISRDAEKTEEELVRLSIEFINVCSKNMSDSRKLESLDDELKKVHEKLKEVQVDISNRKSNPETDAGSKSERIQKYVLCVLDSTYRL